MAREYISVHLDRRVRERARHRCEYCQCPASHSTETFCIEHIVPVAKSGATEEANLALSCGGCNLNKATRTSGFDEITQQNASLFNPRRDLWSEHFAWSDDHLAIVPLSPTGRVTLTALKLNRLGVRNIREGLLALGRHPAQEENSPP